MQVYYTRYMITSIIWIVSFGVSLLLIGVVASFSIVLYIALFTALSGAKRPFRNGLLLIAGLAGSLLLLAMLFMATQPEIFSTQTVIEIVGALRTNVVDMALGLLCFTSGVYVLYRKRTPQDIQELNELKKPKLSKMKAGGTAFVSLGFIRGLTRVAGIAALLLAVRMISHAVDQLTFQLLWVLILVILSMTPYVTIFVLRLWYPVIFLRSQKILKRIVALRPQRYVGEILAGVGVLFVGLSFLK